MRKTKNKNLSFVLTIVFCLVMCATSSAEWKDHEIQQLNGKAKRIKLPAKLQILTESWTGRWIDEWNQVAAVPYIVYIPEKDRVLMLVGVGNPHQAVLLSSDDHGKTWSEPWYVHTDENGKSDTGLGVEFTYVGDGKLFLRSSQYLLSEEDENWRYMLWYSKDYGKTWEKSSALPPHVWSWDPGLVDTDPKTGKVTRIWKTCLTGGDIFTGTEPNAIPRPWSFGYLYWSDDEGRTWTDPVKIPQWEGLNEIGLIRANSGDIIAACRTDIIDKFAHNYNDNYAGLKISISKDNAKTWSAPKTLYNWGRHHPSLVGLANGDIVMTHAARKGYVDTPEGYPQFGVEALISRDNGQKWDLDHRFILAAWPGNRTDEGWKWARGSQQTSSVLLPDGLILTAFGTGFRANVPRLKEDEQKFNPRDVGLVKWRVNNKGLNKDTTIADAPPESDLRNVFDPKWNTFKQTAK